MAGMSNQRDQPEEGGKAEGEGDGGRYDQSTLYICKKIAYWSSLKIVNRKQKRAIRKSDRGVNMIKVHYMHV
jgi:hypothetical protein